jgi:hypothetical protein
MATMWSSRYDADATVPNNARENRKTRRVSCAGGFGGFLCPMPRNAIQIRDADDDIAGGLTAGYRPNLATTPAVASATLGRPLVRVLLAGSGRLQADRFQRAVGRSWFPAAPCG